MKSTLEQQAALRLMGIGVRTTNQEEAGQSGRIPALWTRYFQLEGVEASKAQAQDDFIYGVYTDYETDASGAYTAFIGRTYDLDLSITTGTAAPADMQQIVVPGSMYRVFETRRGRVPQVVIEAWQDIWAYYETAAEQRAYSGDFERYDKNAFQDGEAVVRIYIAIKS
ncbi:Predicted transcriptional regulator YdeE, contains AraC-type DNA-binding domain [Paenibacillus algorifonticola]|uniref:Predicted transcriptional regulator YdeE, contains AraC-type DNA-binding domain n=1 Tax=Paenibacillus algorifonticola TaxID=684063 RepID=A0A1I2IJA5_9BACL|nr:GyrI-like domain-containing protein [Paenibacillus algorifonticola]SFF41728.1 Predicted transcriptional regulator YdeE, contains AraC-type DNA-binding domain [Paenibacillus algorifonticola]